MATLGLIEYDAASPEVRAVYDDIMATRKTDWISAATASRRIRRQPARQGMAMPKGLSVIRYAWAAPTTTLGLLIVLAGLRRAQLRVVDGVLEVHGPTLAWLLSHLTLIPGGVVALTLGHVVIARDDWSLESTRAHERVHVRQCEVWGPFFVPAYLAASLSALLRGRRFYFDNRFEVEAFDSPNPSRDPLR
jgi:hypothetical protein